MPDVLVENVPLALVQSIAAFAAEWHHVVFDPDQAAERCFALSQAFVEALEADTDLDAEVVSGCKFDALGGFMVVVAGHAAVRVGNVVVDWTYRQFDPETPVPRVQTYEEWRQEWEQLGSVSQ